MMTRKQLVLETMQTGDILSTNSGIGMGIKQLPYYIHALRKEGYKISSLPKANVLGSRYVEYVLR